MAWWKPRCKTDSILLTKQEPRHRCPGTDHSSPQHILPNAKRSTKRNSLSCKLSYGGGNPNLELRMKATRRHLRSPPSLLCGYTARWRLRAAGRAGLWQRQQICALPALSGWRRSPQTAISPPPPRLALPSSNLIYSSAILNPTAEHASLVRQRRQSLGFPQLSNTTIQLPYLTAR